MQRLGIPPGQNLPFAVEAVRDNFPHFVEILDAILVIGAGTGLGIGV
jgi:hypothetical protein